MNGLDKRYRGRCGFGQSASPAAENIHIYVYVMFYIMYIYGVFSRTGNKEPTRSSWYVFPITKLTKLLFTHSTWLGSSKLRDKVTIH